ncbi:MAG: TIGR03435 family protein [Bryobacteraceae bacterium]
MRPLMRVAISLALALMRAYGAANGPSFEVASIKRASASADFFCSGGPGTSDPGLWRCSAAPLAFLIANAYGFQPPQFIPNLQSCCQARYDVSARVPPGTTKDQFQRMQQNLLVERLKLSLHHEQKEMAIYELTVREKGLKMKESAPGAALAAEEPWWKSPQHSMGKDGYPVFPVGRGGLAEGNGYYRWTAVNVSMPEIVKTLATYLGRPVIDATGLRGKYDIDMTWIVDISEITASLAARGVFGDSPDDVPRVAGPDSGPTLQHAVQDQLGLELNSKKGLGDIVVVDRVAKVPIEN